MREYSKMNVSYTSLVTVSSIFLFSNEQFYWKDLTNYLKNKPLEIPSYGYIYIPCLNLQHYKIFCGSTHASKLEYSNNKNIKNDGTLSLRHQFLSRQESPSSKPRNFRAATSSYRIYFWIILEQSKNLSNIIKILIKSIKNN